MIVQNRTYTVGILLIFVGSTLSASIAGQLSLLNSVLDSLFPNEDDTTTTIHENVLSDQQVCICTPFYACKTYTQHNDGGRHNVDSSIWINYDAPCSSYLDICCNDTIKTLLNQDIPNISHSNIDEHGTGSNSKRKRETSTDSSTDNSRDNNDDGGDGVDNSTDKDCGCVDIESFNNEDIITIKPTEISVDVQNPANTDDTSFKDTNKCGIWNKNGLGSKIKDEGSSQLGEYPSMVAIFIEEGSKIDEKEFMYHCGGSLIRKNIVLTAAHCVNKKPSSTFVVRAGEWDLNTEKELFPHQDRGVSKIIVHPEYYAGALHNDVALIVLEDSFKLQENIQIMCLPKEDEIFTNTLCYASGWGKTASFNTYTISKKTISNNNNTSKYEVNILKNVELPIISREKCMDALRGTRLGPKFILHDSFICAGGEKGKDTCRGDGGGPLMCPSKDDPNYLVQTGIVAWGIDCGLNGIPGTYVNVARFRNWIDKEIDNYHA